MNIALLSCLFFSYCPHLVFWVQGDFLKADIKTLGLWRGCDLSDSKVAVSHMWSLPQNLQLLELHFSTTSVLYGHTSHSPEVTSAWWQLSCSCLKQLLCASELSEIRAALQALGGAILHGGCPRLCSFQNISEPSESYRRRIFLVYGEDTKFFP